MLQKFGGCFQGSNHISMWPAWTLPEIWRDLHPCPELRANSSNIINFRFTRTFIRRNDKGIPLPVVFGSHMVDLLVGISCAAVPKNIVTLVFSTFCLRTFMIVSGHKNALECVHHV